MTKGHDDNVAAVGISVFFFFLRNDSRQRLVAMFSHDLQFTVKLIFPFRRGKSFSLTEKSKSCSEANFQTQTMKSFLVEIKSIFSCRVQTEPLQWEPERASIKPARARWNSIRFFLILLEFWCWFLFLWTFLLCPIYSELTFLWLFVLLGISCETRAGRVTWPHAEWRWVAMRKLIHHSQ